VEAAKGDSTESRVRINPFALDSHAQRTSARLSPTLA
jgi:hypothetical protein